MNTVLKNQTIDGKERIMLEYFSKLKSGQYEAIICDELYYTKEDNICDIVNILLLDEPSEVEIINDDLVIHNEKNLILKGYKKINKQEIVIRQFLESCYCEVYVQDINDDFIDDNAKYYEAEELARKIESVINVDVINRNRIKVEYEKGNIEYWLRY
ncbi:hypothetical protein [Clostridium botulinum]|uniref:hypothetical protein n=1 Tax=Clostridium botulinum TaxID=1491 RepID=UPI001C9AAFAC|nr:hypothetical protein [Clostridium botulinum]MBY6838850.1 hypothetical protein [Clostridium botulinum]